MDIWKDISEFPINELLVFWEFLNPFVRVQLISIPTHFDFSDILISSHSETFVWKEFSISLFWLSLGLLA